MRKTLTIRTDEALARALRERAAKRGTTLSEAAREILRDAVVPRAIGTRAGHLRGRLNPRGEEGEGDVWRETLRRRNWRT